jgi:hypothetical protein
MSQVRMPPNEALQPTGTAMLVLRVSTLFQAAPLLSLGVRRAVRI